MFLLCASIKLFQVTIYSQLFRRSAVRGSSTGFVPVGPTKVKASKSILFNEGTPEGKIKLNSQFCWIAIDCDQNGDRISKNDEKLPYLQ